MKGCEADPNASRENPAGLARYTGIAWWQPVKKPRRTANPRRKATVLSIKAWPRSISRLGPREFLIWIHNATRLTPEEVLSNPHLARDRLLAAFKRVRQAARKRRRERL